MENIDQTKFNHAVSTVNETLSQPAKMIDPITILSILSTIIPLINNGMAWLSQTKEIANRDAGWTEDQIAQRKAELDKLEVDPEEWQKPQPL
jgi:hypothetical protein